MLETMVAAHIDQVLSFLSINKTPDSSGDPVLSVNARIIAIGHVQLKMHFIGTSLVLLEGMLLAREFNWVPPVITPSPPKNATAEVWSTPDTASVVADETIGIQLLQDVDRLIDAFASEWSEANK
jgi:hypothetical protein